MQNTNSEPPRDGPDAHYGWIGNDPPEAERGGKRERSGLGKRLLFAMAGIALILTGVALLVGVSANVTSVSSVQVSIQRPSVPQPTISPAPTPPNEVIVKRASIDSGGSSLDTAIDLSGITDIYLKATAADVVIKATGGYELDISIQTYGSSEYVTSVSDGKVVIDNNNTLSAAIGKKADKVALRIPEAYEGNLWLELAAATASVSEISGDELVIKLAAGELSLDGVEYRLLNAELGAGRAQGRELSFGGMDIQVGQGEVDFSGDMGITHSSSAAGAVKLEYTCAPEAISLNVALGDVHVYLPEDTEVSTQSEIMMGSVQSDFKNSDNPECNISVSMTMGSVSLHGTD